MSELYKVLGPAGQSISGGQGEWFLPNGKPGKWMPQITEPLCCKRGYHLVELYSLPEWLTGDCTIYLAEGKGAKHSDGSGKTAFAQARLIRQLHISEKDLRLFAADCAEHVLPIWEKQYPKDDRPKKAIQAARDFAHGRIDDAAGDATWAAARDAATAAAWDAARAAAWDATGDATWAAARAAATAAAWDAARDATGDATGAAARAAAWDATGDATWAAARDAATAAAWDAARAAERRWQSEILITYLRTEGEGDG